MNIKILLYIIINKILLLIKSLLFKKICVFPSHIAFIMDGNGRWGMKKNNNRLYGHAHGADNLNKIIKECFNNGTKYLTFYVFSEENWSRPKDEIQLIFNMVYKQIKHFQKEK
jgi:undecaprenyl diphosphate synthase